MEQLVLDALSKEGIFAIGFFALVIYVLKTTNDRELRYINIINIFTERFDTIDEKIEGTDKKIDSTDKKVDLLIGLKTNGKE